MKTFKFLAYSLLMLAFFFSGTVTAKEQRFTKIKTELVQCQSDYHLVTLTFETPVFVESNSLQFETVNILNYNHHNFATVINISWCCNNFVSNYAIYKEQLNSRYLIDKRQLLETTGVKQKQRSC